MDVEKAHVEAENVGEDDDAPVVAVALSGFGAVGRVAGREEGVGHGGFAVIRAPRQAGVEGQRHDEGLAVRRQAMGGGQHMVRADQGAGAGALGHGQQADGAPGHLRGVDEDAVVAAEIVVARFGGAAAAFAVGGVGVLRAEAGAGGFVAGGVEGAVAAVVAVAQPCDGGAVGRVRARHAEAAADAGFVAFAVIGVLAAVVAADGECATIGGVGAGGAGAGAA